MKAEIWYHPYDEYADPRQLTHLSSTELYEYGAEDIASLYVPRTEIDPQQVDEGYDEAELRLGGTPVFRGPIEEVIRNDNEKELIVESGEAYAARAEPGPQRQPFQNVSDAHVIRDAIDDVPELEPGAIEPIETVNKQFSTSSPAYRMRKIEDISRGMLRFNPDMTVDYGRLGRNKTHRTLSPKRDNVDNDVEVDRESGEEEVTHLRMLGTGEGEHQVSADAVADEYQPGDPQIWKVKPDKSIGEKDTLQTKADKLVEELKVKLLEVELTVEGIDVNLGDMFRVYVPGEEVNHYLEVVEHEREIRSKGVFHHLTLSNHRDSREDPEEQNRADIENYNSSIEGHGQTLNISDGYQALEPPDANYHLRFLYPPEVEYEHRLNLHIFAEPYRTYSAGSLDNADFETAYRSNSGVTSVNDIPRTWDNLTTVVPPDGAESSTLFLMINTRVHGIGSDEGAEIEFRYDRDGYRIPDPANEAETDAYKYRFTGNTQNTVTFIDPTDVSGEEIDIEMRVSEVYSDDPDPTVNMTATFMAVAAGRHVHAPSPGVIEAFDDDFDPENPSDPGPNADRHVTDGATVYVNGSDVGHVSGTLGDRWTDSIDIRGELNEGELNEVRIEPDGLTGMSALVEGYVYERISSDIQIS